MNKALVIGGSNGIGLAISLNLIMKGYSVIIVDKCAPQSELLPNDSYVYHACDLLEPDEDLITSLASDTDISLLMITAGFGRVADFEFFHPSEIRKMITLNTISTICILTMFYERIKDRRPFYCGVMSSISGILVSPAAAVYSASKAAICKLIESVNIELEISGTENRILNVSPAAFRGSCFYGGSNQIELLESLAQNIIKHLIRHDTLYIPHYNDKLKDVINRYHEDPHKFGIESDQYKHRSDRLDNTRKAQIGYLSGTFDLFHVGHLNLLQRAKQHCDYLIVGVHDSGAWKGKETFIPFEERMKIVGACKYVDKVVKSCREDSDAWNLWHFDKLFVGSDYKGTDRFLRYEEFFRDKGVEIVYFPYTQSTSSTQIRNTIILKTKDNETK